MSGFCFGGDYNPEQWSEKTWQEDIELMRAAGVNLVSLGVFAWSALEPRPGEYTFGWLDRVFDLLHEGEVKVALATPTASPPPWFSVAHPEALPVSPDGTHLTHGSRDTYCPSAPAYREAALKICRALAERYAHHPALALWHVHNEYGTDCVCDYVADAFRTWLRRRYGDLGELNRSWTTSFWSQGYRAWEEILPPRATRYLSNPAQLLDFRRFMSDELFACFAEQRAILREITPEVPVTTNFVFGDWVPVDHRQWAEDLDVVAIDHYPSSPGISAAEQTAFHSDLARSWAGGRPWLLMEQSCGTVRDGGGRNIAKNPGEMTRHSLSYIARGSRGAMFFQWRASRGGAEQYHAALVPHAGPNTELFREVMELGRLLPRLSELDGAAVEAPVAIVWDAQAWWALQGPGLPSPDVRYLDALYAAHRALWRAGLSADFVDPEADLTRYPLVLVPSLYLITDQGAGSVRRYVDAGGHVLIWYFSGIVDERAQVRLHGYPGAFRDVLGVRVEQFRPLGPGEEIALVPESSTEGNALSGRSLAGAVWSERMNLDGAAAVARYVSGPLAGLPAITRNQCGQGVAWYLSTRLGEDELGAMLDLVMAGAGVSPRIAPVPDVEVVFRVKNGVQWMVVLNHGDQIRSLPLAGGVSGFAGGTDLVTRAVVGDAVTVPPGGLAVLRSPVVQGKVC